MIKGIFDLIKQEQQRQQATINLIASENYAPADILQTTGSILTNKYAEGYPGARYYGGCQVVDMIENMAIDEAKKTFGAEHANVQPHSGSSANRAAYQAVLQPGDTVLGMALPHGGHLTHGHRINFSGQFYNFVPYHVSPETELLDYDELSVLADQHKPKLIVVGASAYSRAIDFARCAEIAKRHHALLMVDMAHIAGLIAAGLHQNPTPYADIVTSTSHKTLRGPRGGFILCKQELAAKIDKAVMPGSQGGPLMHVIAAKAIAFQAAQTEEFKIYQQQVIKNAQAMAESFMSKGYRIVAGGTDNHLFLVDLSSHNDELLSHDLDGAIAEKALEQCNIVLNRNSIPFDKRSPFTPSGIRIGTPTITTRGMREKESLIIVDLIDQVLKQRDDKNVLADIKKQAEALCEQFPL